MNTERTYPRVEIVIKAAGNLGKHGPQALLRIQRFCKLYDSDADPDVLGNAIWAEMASDAPGTIVCVGVDLINGEEVIFAHLVAIAELYYRKNPIITVTQTEIDKAWVGDRGPIYDSGMDILSWWAKLIAADKIRVVARNGGAAVIFKRQCGFRDTGRVVLSVDVPGGD